MLKSREKHFVTTCKWREAECFPINRGQLWYDRLSEKQKAELQVWYSDWLVTDTLTAPEKPSWLN